MESQINATIIADSKNIQGDRITTYILTFPRIILSEFNTHRVLSKNSASSRAIPFKRMIKLVQEAPFIPLRWMKEHKGMQGTEYYTNEEVKALQLVEDHLAARDAAVEKALKQSAKGVTKQICNRYLEPFLMHTVLVTGTEWENFFSLRAHGDAEIHIADLAHKMLEAYNASEPKLLQPGEWHIPFGEQFDEERLREVMIQGLGETTEREIYMEEPMVKVKIATARCARTSYLNFEGKDDYFEDVKLHDRLLTGSPIHASPSEHCAQAMSEPEYATQYLRREGENVENGWCRNFRGFKQYRIMLPNDTAKDNRVIKK